MSTLWQDLRYGFRMLLKSPGFTAVAVLTLALGIGANTAIFSVVNAVLLRPLPYPEPDRLVMVFPTVRRGGLSTRIGSVTDPDFVEWRAENRVFEGMAAYGAGPANLTGGSGEPERVFRALTTASLFPVLGVKPILGRTFLGEEEQPGRDHVAILSERLFQRGFGSDPTLLGKTIKLDGERFTVVGIMPADFRFPPRANVELWTPVILDKTRANAYHQVIARLKPGVTRAQAQTEMETIARRLEQEYPKTNKGLSASIIPLHEQVVGNARASLWVFLGAVGFVLLVACANVANLLLARAAARQKEVAVRAALGASRGRLIRQFLTESGLLSLLGGAAGLLLALWGVFLLVTLIPAKSIPRVGEIRIDGWVLGFTLALSLLTGMVFGLVPALGATKPDLNESLKEGSRTSTGGFRQHRLRSLLVVSEMALALVLLIGAGLMIKSFLRLRAVKPGFHPENVLTMTVTLPPSVYRTDVQSKAFHQQVLERIGALPGVLHAGAINFLPLGPFSIQGDFVIEGQPAPPPGLLVLKPAVSSDYFRALGIPLLKGRFFTERDTAQAPGVAIISESLAHRLWPDEDPLGKRIFPDNPRRGDWLSVVGVVGEVKARGPGAESEPAIYVPYLQVSRPFWLWGMTFVVRTASDPRRLAADLRRTVQAVDPDQPVFDMETMEARLSASVSEPRFNTLLLGTFSVLALVLAAVGIYGVMSYAVTQRTHEIGVRLALGAQTGDVFKLVVGQGMLLALLGAVIGLAASFALTRLIANLLYGVSTTDPATFVVVSLILVGVALGASYIPARRAMKVDPMAALKYE